MLLEEVIAALQVKPGKMYVDATFGSGGHASAMLRHGGRVIVLDRDPDAITEGKTNFAKEITSGRVRLSENRFDCLKAVVGGEKVDGVLFDLGMSTEQIFSGRGFSFADETLDMRMDQKDDLRAADLVNGLSEKELMKLFTVLGEEPEARRIARAIVEERRRMPIKTARELSRIVERVVKKRGVRHPATRVFQALRMAVNDERHQLRSGLADAIDVLQRGGRLVVVSFHSLEDRIVKQFGRQMEQEGRLARITKTPIVPNDEEVRENPRSRSAKMRVFEKRM